MIATLVAVTTVLLAYPAAYYIAFHVHRNKMMWLILITLPFWTSYLLRVFAWKLILGYNGVVNSALITVGLIDQPLDFILYNTNAVVLTLAHAWAAFAILPIFVSLQKIDKSLVEAANDLGENHLEAFVRVTLPLSMPGVISALLLVFIPTVGDYVTPKMVGGPNGIMIGSAHSDRVRTAGQLAPGRGDLGDLHAHGHRHDRLPVPARHRPHKEAGGMSASVHSSGVRWLKYYTIGYLVFIYLPVVFPAGVLVQRRNLCGVPDEGLHAQMVGGDDRADGHAAGAAQQFHGCRAGVPSYPPRWACVRPRH